MRLLHYDGRARMIEFAEQLIKDYKIKATCSLDTAVYQKEEVTLTYCNPPGMDTTYFKFPEKVLFLNNIVPMVPDNHSYRDLFFLIHNLVNHHKTPRGVKRANQTFIDPTSTIGCEGIGLFNLYGRRISIKHMGGVRIGTGVEIGPNTCVARGVLDDTIIEEFVRIGYNCNIGHNSYIAKGTTIVDGANLGGSVRIGDDCWIGLGASIKQGITICGHVMIGMGAVVVKDIRNSFTKHAGVPAKQIGEWEGDY